MTEEEYSKLFHKEQLNLVALKMLFQCDKEVLRLVNAAIAAEREACAKLCDEAEARFEELWSKFAYPPTKGAAEASRQLSAAIRARGETK